MTPHHPPHAADAPPTLKGFDLLVVDHRGAVTQALTETLKTTGGARVACIPTARDALGVLAPFDAVLCGEALSDIDPWRFTRLLRSGRFCAPDLPVCVLCDNPDDPTVQVLADDVGAVVLKPSPASALIQAVADAIARRAKHSVLIIEDNAQAADSARRTLETNFVVEVCADGDSGLNAWLRARHALVLLDLQLPKRPGEGVLAEILAVEPAQPVVILTGHAEPARHQALMFAGAAEFLAKPFEPNALRDTCHTVLRAEKLQRAQAHSVSTQRATEQLGAAHDLLSHGHTQSAAAVLKRARQDVRTQPLSDDEWARIKAEFE